jgi:hypothetical protein
MSESVRAFFYGRNGGKTGMRQFLVIATAVAFGVIVGIRFGIALWQIYLPQMRCQDAVSYHGFDLICLVKWGQ